MGLCRVFHRISCIWKGKITQDRADPLSLRVARSYKLFTHLQRRCLALINEYTYRFDKIHPHAKTLRTIFHSALARHHFPEVDEGLSLELVKPYLPRFPTRGECPENVRRVLAIGLELSDRPTRDACEWPLRTPQTLFRALYGYQFLQNQEMKWTRRPVPAWLGSFVSWTPLRDNMHHAIKLQREVLMSVADSLLEMSQCPLIKV